MCTAVQYCSEDYTLFKSRRMRSQPASPETSPRAWGLSNLSEPAQRPASATFSRILGMIFSSSSTDGSFIPRSASTSFDSLRLPPAAVQAETPRAAMTAAELQFRLEQAIQDPVFSQALVQELLAEHLGKLALQVRFVSAVLQVQRSHVSSRTRRSMMRKVKQVFYDDQSPFQMSNDDLPMAARRLGRWWSPESLERSLLNSKSAILEHLCDCPTVLKQLELRN